MQQRNRKGKTTNYVTLQNVYEETWKYKKNRNSEKGNL